jgi:hypothetical protein
VAEVIEPPPLPQPVCRDPDDDQVLALAIAAKVELIVSGDNDLLSLGSFEGINIARGVVGQAAGGVGEAGEPVARRRGGVGAGGAVERDAGASRQGRAERYCG